MLLGSQRVGRWSVPCQPVGRDVSWIERQRTMYDIAIAGGGVIGSSIAYHLTRSGRAGRVAVIEPDPSYEFASTPRSAGGVRRLFSLPENIQMSAFSLAFYLDFERLTAVNGETTPLGFRRQGYLFLYPPEKLDVVRKTFEAQ